MACHTKITPPKIGLARTVFGTKTCVYWPSQTTFATQINLAGQSSFAKFGPPAVVDPEILEGVCTGGRSQMQGSGGTPSSH